MNTRRVACLLTKELSQLRRDKRLLGILILAPVIQLVVIGFAATTDIRDIAVAIRDRDHSWHSREYARSLGASGYFKTFPAAGPQEGDGNLLVYGKAGLVLEIPEGFGALLDAGRPARVQALADGSDSNFGVQGLNYLQRATSLFSDNLARSFTARSGFQPPAPPAIRIESRAWYNPGLVSRVFMTPAIMALLMMVVTTLITSMALVKEREDGTLEQIMVTPLRPAELIAGKMLPYVIIGFIGLTLALGMITWVFRIPMRGSALLLYGMDRAVPADTLGLGLFIPRWSRPAAGNDGGRFLCDDAVHAPVGVRVSGGKHAARHPVGVGIHPAYAFSHNHPLDFPERRRPRNAVAPGPGPVRVGICHSCAGRAALPEKAGMMKSSRSEQDRPEKPLCARGPGWEHFEHASDIGVRGFGADPASAFANAALALTAIITPPDLVAQIAPRGHRRSDKDTGNRFSWTG